MLWMGDRTRELDGAHVELEEFRTLLVAKLEQPWMRTELIKLIDF